MRAALALLLIAAAALVAACGSSSSSAPKEAFNAGNCDGDVGVMLTYGGFGAGDTIQMNWARVALDKFNQTHGSAFGFVPANVDADTEMGVKEAKRLAGDQGVIGIVGPKTSVVTKAVGPIFDAANLVYVSPSATNETLTDGKLRNFYRVVASDALQAPTMGTFIAERLKPSTVLIVRDDEPYSQGLADGLAKRLDELKIRNRTIDVKVGQKDYADVALQVDHTVNVVALPILDAKDAVRLVNQLWKQGKYPKFIGGDAVFMKAFAVPGAYVTTYSPDSSTQPEAADLVRLYQTIFGDFEQYGAPSYVAMEIVLEAALEVCREDGEVTRGAMVRQLPRTRLETSILGMPIAFTPEHELEGATISVYQVGPRGFELVG